MAWRLASVWVVVLGPLSDVIHDHMPHIFSKPKFPFRPVISPCVISRVERWWWAPSGCDAPQTTARARVRTLWRGRNMLLRVLSLALLATPVIEGIDSRRSLVALDKIRFFHVPKAGSSFAPIVWGIVCDVNGASLALRLTRGITVLPDGVRRGRCDARYLGGGARVDPDYHHAGTETDAAAAAAIGVFRDPAPRIVSAYNYGMHVHCARDCTGRIGRKSLERLPEANATRLLAFARLPEVRNTATKMLLGWSPGRPRAVSADEATVALSRVADFKFVAITECLAEAADLLRDAARDWGYVDARPPALEVTRTNNNMSADERSREAWAVAEDLRRRGGRGDSAYDFDVEVYDVVACRFHRARHAARVQPRSPACVASALAFSPRFCRCVDADAGDRLAQNATRHL